jgi:hypothetical protein
MIYETFCRSCYQNSEGCTSVVDGSVFFVQKQIVSSMNSLDAYDVEANHRKANWITTGFASFILLWRFRNLEAPPHPCEFYSKYFGPVSPQTHMMEYYKIYKEETFTRNEYTVAGDECDDRITVPATDLTITLDFETPDTELLPLYFYGDSFYPLQRVAVNFLKTVNGEDNGIYFFRDDRQGWFEPDFTASADSISFTAVSGGDGCGPAYFQTVTAEHSIGGDEFTSSSLNQLVNTGLAAANPASLPYINPTGGNHLFARSSTLYAICGTAYFNPYFAFKNENFSPMSVYKEFWYPDGYPDCDPLDVTFDPELTKELQLTKASSYGKIAFSIPETCYLKVWLLEAEYDLLPAFNPENYSYSYTVNVIEQEITEQVINIKSSGGRCDLISPPNYLSVGADVDDGLGEFVLDASTLNPPEDGLMASKAAINSMAEYNGVYGDRADSFKIKIKTVVAWSALEDYTPPIYVRPRTQVEANFFNMELLSAGFSGGELSLSGFEIYNPFSGFPPLPQEKEDFDEWWNSTNPTPPP